MKNYIKFTIKSLPLVFGLILTLISLTFLIGFATDIYVEKFQEIEFILFVVFAVIGFPTLLYGINYLANNKATPSNSTPQSMDLSEFREPGSH
jgi:hypothetical protein